MKAKPDPINPSHYQSKGMQACEVVEAFDLPHNLAAAVEYILRAGKKNDEVEDLRKAVWNLERYIGRKAAKP